MDWLSPQELEALDLSLRVAGLAVVVGLPIAVATAFLLSRFRFPGRAIVSAAVQLPLVLPPVVTGYGLLLLFGRHGSIGAFLDQTVGIVLAFRWTGAALAAGVMSFPLMVRTIQLAFDAVDQRLEDAAATLGAPAWAVFATVTLPLALPGLGAALLVGFAKSLGEFGATITFVSNIPGETRTLPIAIYSLLQVPGADTMVLRLAAVSALTSLGTVLVAEALSARLERRRAPP
jgi:molybdate transport system permease protein